MSMQRIFNRVAKHLMEQGRRSMLTGNRRLAAKKRLMDEYGQSVVGKCAYRSDDGLKCAVGCLIPNRYYSERMEGKAICSLYGEYKFFDRFSSQELSMLSELQHTHDFTPPRSWKTQLRILAKKYDLNIPDSLK